MSAVIVTSEPSVRIDAERAQTAMSPPTSGASRKSVITDAV